MGVALRCLCGVHERALLVSENEREGARTDWRGCWGREPILDSNCDLQLLPATGLHDR